jgi:hypothetical protein
MGSDAMVHSGISKLPTMPAMGQKRRSYPLSNTSGFPLTTEIIRARRLVRFVPSTDFPRHLRSP